MNTLPFQVEPLLLDSSGVIRIDNDLNLAVRHLSSHIGKAVSVTKQEIQIGSSKVADTDHIVLRLDNVTVRRSGYTDSDDYVARQELILHGQGSIHDRVGSSPLPQNAYEIPLVGHFTAKPTQDGLDIETERALYQINYN